MDGKTAARTLRENWPLALVFVLAMAGVGAGLFRAFSGGGGGNAGTIRISPFNPSTVVSEAQMREILFSPDGPAPPTVQEEKHTIVNAHRERYDANPNDPDAEPLLHAMGNLYKQTGDIKNAAWAYQNFLTRFPNSPDRSAVYLELVGCYELLDEKDNLSRLLQDMMSVFPPDSNEYKYAEGSLKIKRLKMRPRDPNARPQPGPEGTFTVEKSADGTTRYVESIAIPTAADPHPIDSTSKPDTAIPVADSSMPESESSAQTPTEQTGS